MSYLDVISLENAKTYLGVDDTSRDGEITRMINASLSYLERVTNIILFDRDKVYNYDNGCVRVYDYPINSTTSTTHDADVKSTYSIYTENDIDIKTITINVGYTDSINIPSDLIETGYAIIECLFNGGSVAKLPELIKDMVDANKRFII